MLALPAREQAEQRWQAAVAVLLKAAEIWRAVPVYRKGELRAGAAQRRRRGACSRAAPHQGRALEGSTGHASVLQLGHIVATDANDPASRDLLATVLILLECVGCARNSDLCVLRDVNRHILW